MTYTMRCLDIGDCFRVIDGDLNDKPSYADSCNRRTPRDLPAGWEACDVDDKEDQLSWWDKHGDEKIIFLEHYSRDPNGTQLTRAHIRLGECFQYVTNEGDERPFIMAAVHGPRIDLPAGWGISYIDRTNLNHRLVRRIPRWDHEGPWKGIPNVDASELPRADVPAKPPVGSPLRKLLDKKVDGITGEVCFQRLLEAQQTESLCRTAGGFVSTLGTAPLNEVQVELALEIWPLMLAERRAQQDAYDKAHAVSIVVQCDELEPW